MESFNKRFWYAEGEYLYDIVDGEQGDDPSFRPNQIFAVSLDHPVLEPSALGQGGRDCQGATADASRVEDAIAGTSRLQGEVLWRPSRA